MDGKWQLSRAGKSPGPPRFHSNAIPPHLVLASELWWHSDTPWSNQHKLQEQTSDTSIHSSSGNSWHNIHLSSPWSQAVGATPSETGTLSPNLSLTHTHTHTITCLTWGSLSCWSVCSTNPERKLCWQSFPDTGSARGPLWPHAALRRSRAQPAMTDTTAEEAHNNGELESGARPSSINTSWQWRPISLTLANSAIFKIDLIQLLCNGLSYRFYWFLAYHCFFLCVCPISSSFPFLLLLNLLVHVWVSLLERISG